jgi:hypothetical protein
MELQDWALDVHLVSGEEEPLLSVALALGGTWEDSDLVEETVLSQLVLWRPGGAQPDRKGPVERCLPGHRCVFFSLCYRRETGVRTPVSSVKLSPRRVYSTGEDGVSVVGLGRWGRVGRTLNGYRAGGVRAVSE